MASSINASTSGAGGVITTADSSGVLNIQTAGNTAVTVDASQNVGIGTSSPTYNFHVKETDGATSISSLFETTVAGGSYISFKDPNTAQPYNVRVGSVGENLAFQTSSAERMRITSTGQIGIGNDNPNGYNSAFTAITTSSYLPLFVGNTNTSATGPGIIVAKWLNSNATSNVLMQFLINGVATGSGQINANGASAAAFGSYSDARLKENIEPLPSQLDNILALKPSEFDYKDGSGHQIGFIAQEMQEVYPDVVSEGENDMLTITGWSKTEARLVKAIQEQQTIINDLKARIEILEAK